MYLLDTTHCIEALDSNTSIQRRMDLSDDLAPIGTCVIVRAELLYMAYQSRRVDENISAVEELLDGLRVYPVDDDAAHHFGQSKMLLLNRFGPKDRTKQRRFTLQHLGISDNDLWIAAIALRYDLTVVTSDGDFKRIAEVTDLRYESWLERNQ